MDIGSFGTDYAEWTDPCFVSGIISTTGAL